jgi:hypothetical protein
MGDLAADNRRMIWVRDAMPGEWLEYADELLDAAEVLWHSPTAGLRVESDVDPITSELMLYRFSTVSRPYVLLSSFALENLLKGVLVARDPSLISTGRLPPTFTTHKLSRLSAKIAGLGLSPEEVSVLTIAEKALPYWGRYPVPLIPDGVLPEIAIDEEYRSTYLALHYRLGKIIYDAIRDGWDSGVGARHDKGTFIPRYEE